MDRHTPAHETAPQHTHQTTQQLTREEALTALLKFVDTEYTSLVQALGMAAEKNRLDASAFTGSVGKMLRQSADMWDGIARRLTTVLNNASDADLFPH